MTSIIRNSLALCTLLCICASTINGTHVSRKTQELDQGNEEFLPGLHICPSKVEEYECEAEIECSWDPYTGCIYTGEVIEEPGNIPHQNDTAIHTRAPSRFPTRTPTSSPTNIPPTPFVATNSSTSNDTNPSGSNSWCSDIVNDVVCEDSILCFWDGKQCLYRGDAEPTNPTATNYSSNYTLEYNSTLSPTRSPTPLWLLESNSNTTDERNVTIGDGNYTTGNDNFTYGDGNYVGNFCSIITVEFDCDESMLCIWRSHECVYANEEVLPPNTTLANETYTGTPTDSPTTPYQGNHTSYQGSNSTSNNTIGGDVDNNYCGQFQDSTICNDTYTCEWVDDQCVELAEEEPSELPLNDTEIITRAPGTRNPTLSPTVMEQTTDQPTASSQGNHTSYQGSNSTSNNTIGGDVDNNYCGQFQDSTICNDTYTCEWVDDQCVELAEEEPSELPLNDTEIITRAPGTRNPTLSPTVMEQTTDQPTASSQGNHTSYQGSNSTSNNTIGGDVDNNYCGQFQDSTICNDTYTCEWVDDQCVELAEEEPSELPLNDTEIITRAPGTRNPTLSPTISPTSPTSSPSMSPTSSPTGDPQLVAWRNFYDATTGRNWFGCRIRRNSPCSCNARVTRTVTCDDSGEITSIVLRANRLSASEFPKEEIAALLDLPSLTRIDLGSNNLLAVEATCVDFPQCATKTCQFGNTIVCQNTMEPTIAPSQAPTSSPSAAPTNVPTVAPTNFPTSTPTQSPASVPTSSPTSVPTSSPTSVPTSSPTSVPTSSPTSVPTSSPTSVPTSSPTSVPTSSPTSVPTSSPTSVPTSSPTSVPTASPTSVPTASPTSVPTSSPTSVPTALPTSVPTSSPTSVPTALPTSVPTSSPTSVPTALPTSAPTQPPTSVPTTSTTTAPLTSTPTTSTTISPS